MKGIELYTHTQHTRGFTTMFFISLVNDDIVENVHTKYLIARICVVKRVNRVERSARVMRVY